LPPLIIAFAYLNGMSSRGKITDHKHAFPVRFYGGVFPHSIIAHMVIAHIAAINHDRYFRIGHGLAFLVDHLAYQHLHVGISHPFIIFIRSPMVFV
jgi:hypothetical protein